MKVPFQKEFVLQFIKTSFTSKTHSWTLSWFFVQSCRKKHTVQKKMKFNFLMYIVECLEYWKNEGENEINNKKSFYTHLHLSKSHPNSEKKIIWLVDCAQIPTDFGSFKASWKWEESHVWEKVSRDFFFLLPFIRYT